MWHRTVVYTVIGPIVGKPNIVQKLMYMYDIMPPEGNRTMTTGNMHRQATSQLVTWTSHHAVMLSISQLVTGAFLGHLIWDDLINTVKISVRMSTIKLNAATNQILVFVKVDEPFTMIWLSRSSEVRVKVTWDLSFKNDDFHNLSHPPFFNRSKKNSNSFWY